MHLDSANDDVNTLYVNHDRSKVTVEGQKQPQNNNYYIYAVALGDLKINIVRKLSKLAHATHRNLEKENVSSLDAQTSSTCTQHRAKDTKAIDVPI